MKEKKSWVLSIRRTRF